VLGWEPEISLEEGLAITYAWIEAEVRKTLRQSAQAGTANHLQA
jgi:hypothetical protein